jgi:hypothetical protein
MDRGHGQEAKPIGKNLNIVNQAACGDKNPRITPAGDERLVLEEMETLNSHPTETGVESLVIYKIRLGLYRARGARELAYLSLLVVRGHLPDLRKCEVGYPMPALGRETWTVGHFQ